MSSSTSTSRNFFENLRPERPAIAAALLAWLAGGASVHDLDASVDARTLFDPPQE